MLKVLKKDQDKDLGPLPPGQFFFTSPLSAFEDTWEA